MVRKKVDARVRALLERGVARQHRSLLVLVGDHGKDQVPNLHAMLSKLRVKARPNVLWCYKKELGFSTHRKKRMRQIRKMVKRGLHDPEKDDPFELFVAGADVRWCYYRDTPKILGRTFGMCVLQDFEALTPNLLARTIETVEGGGIVVLLLRTVKSLKQLYTLTMDVHARLRTEAHHDIVPRFNERFILSLSKCEACLVLDDELNILPVSGAAQSIDVNEEYGAQVGAKSGEQEELEELSTSLAEVDIVGALVAKSKTVDQAQAVMSSIEVLQEKTLRSTVSITASRGRGKSAALGLALAAAIGYGYSNIHITAPSAENLGTVFEFLKSGLEALKYSEHLDFEIQKIRVDGGTEVVSRVVVFKDHRQSVSYIPPDSLPATLIHTELLAIDEAAAIPLPFVKRLLGNYLVFLSSTITGYEGTGRSLSLKLLQQLRQQQGTSAQTAAANAAAEIHGTGRKKGAEKVHEQRWRAAAAAAAAHGEGVGAGRTLREIELKTPIRYGVGDNVETWLYHLLCLDADITKNRLVSGMPAPQDCDLFAVNRDALFSYHALAEGFLQRVMAILTAAHYKNTPDDLQLLSDAPAHALFVLLSPVDKGALPDVLAVVQVCYEGRISQASVKAALARGHKAAGDMIPWILSQQFNDSEVGKLSGARVVRLAVHPDVQGKGYGTRAMVLLSKYFQGELISLSENPATDEEQDDEDDDNDRYGDDDDDDEDVDPARDAQQKDPVDALLQRERLQPRKKLPALLSSVQDQPPKRLHWLGVSFGMTEKLFNFWQRLSFKCVYIRQTANELTGEHSCVMVQSLACEDLPDAPESGWLEAFERDFRRRSISLMGFSFQHFPTTLSTAIISPRGDRKTKPVSVEEMRYAFSAHDLQRLELYGRNLVDHHMITDLLPQLALYYFDARFAGMNLSALQAATLCAVGLQRRTIDDLAGELDLPATQILALFNKSIKKMASALRKLEEEKVEQEMQLQEQKGDKAMKQVQKRVHEGTGEDMEMDMESGARAALAQLHSKKPEKPRSKNHLEVLEELDVMKYAVKGTDDEWKKALSKKGGNPGVQIRSQKERKRKVSLDGDDGKLITDASEAKAKRKKNKRRKQKKD